MSDEIKIVGIENLISKFDDLADDEIIDKAVAKTASYIQANAKLLAPVDTGDLRNSIKTSEVIDHTAEVFTNCDHAVFNEYGTGTQGDPVVSHTTKESWTYMGTDGNFHTSHGMKPRPYMRPAAQAGREEVESIFMNTLKEKINNA